MDLSREKPYLEFLETLDISCSEFCSLGIKSLEKDISPKLYLSAASKLNENPLKIERTVEAIVSILLKAAEQRLSSAALGETLQKSTSCQDTIDCLTRTYDENIQVLCHCLKQISLKYPHYCNVEWRLDILTRTGSLGSMCEPLVSLELQTAQPDGDGCKDWMQTDAKSLLHITSSLEEALQQGHSSHMRKLKQLAPT